MHKGLINNVDKNGNLNPEILAYFMARSCPSDTRKVRLTCSLLWFFFREYIQFSLNAACFNIGFNIDKVEKYETLVEELNACVVRLVAITSKSRHSKLYLIRSISH